MRRAWRTARRSPGPSSTPTTTCSSASDRGRAFLRIMRGFELTEEKQRFFYEGLGARRYPARIVWGERDPALGLDRMRAVQAALGTDDTVLVPAKHFLQEDQAPAVADAIADLVAPLG